MVTKWEKKEIIDDWYKMAFISMSIDDNVHMSWKNNPFTAVTFLIHMFGKQGYCYNMHEFKQKH